MRWLTVAMLSLSAPSVALAVATDPVLRWNAVALEAVAEDHSGMGDDIADYVFEHALLPR